MGKQISITGVTGTPPYSVTVCDMTLTYCYLITGSTTIPPTYIFDLPAPLDEANKVILKIIDSSGCTTYRGCQCPVTPTPTPSITPTPTPTPTNPCRCIQFINTGITFGTFSYKYCDGTDSAILPINPETTLYVCGSDPNPISNCVSYVGNICVNNSCQEIELTPTPSPT